MFSIPYIGWVIPIAALLILVALFKVFIRIFGLVMVPDNRVGVVTKKFSLGKDGKLPDGALIAMKGEAGIQADTLAPGLHFGFWPWQYQVDLVPFATIPEGKIGTVEARDGVPLSGGRVLARQVECNSYQDARAFLSSKGERGPQMAIIPPGTYRINTALFTISTEDGSGLPSGEIAGRMIEGHNMFQNGEIFVAKGGFKGLQEQVILAGRYYINPNFATVEMVDMTEVPIAYAGVVIAYVGEKGADVTGDGFKHGNLVEKGKKGVWIEPLDPGRYPINPRTHRVENVPTANVVLNWATGKSEAHKLDEKLSTITVRSSDGFKFNLDVSQIIHIPRNDAPKVIARFGSMLNLVTQVLEPTIGNYFRNAAQGSDVIEFLNKRAERQQDAREKISAALTEYNVGAVDTLIGDIVPPEDLMKTLTDRKIAEQEKVTYETQCGAEKVRQGLQQAKALADTQAKVVDSERSVAIAEFAAQASVKKAEGEAKSKTMIAEADGNVITTLGRAEAEKTKAVGLAEAEVTTAKVRATDPEKFVAVEIARALSNSGQKLVPDILVSGQGSQEGKGSGTTIIELLAAQMFKDQLRPSKPAAGPAS
jgi:uncharacterized membrane protein YqiK